MSDEREGDRFDPCRWRVSAFPCLKQSVQPKIQFAEGVQARVDGPHPGERLRHLADGVFHCPRADGSVAGGDATGPILLGEEEEDRDKIAGDVAQVGLQTLGGAEARPDSAGRGSGREPIRRLVGSERRRNSDPISAENIAGSRVSSVQEVACG